MDGQRTWTQPDGGGRPSNTAPSGSGGSVPRLLNAGVDSLYLSARGEVRETFVPLLEARARAEAMGEAVAWGEVGGFAFEVMPYARYGYRVLLECAEFSLYATDAANRPTVRVELRSDYIQTVGVDQAWRAAMDVATTVVGTPLQDVKVARLDLFADFGGWRLWRSDWAGLVSRAKVRAIGEPEPGGIETYQVGITPLLVRLYRKDIEVRERGGFASVFWDGYTGPVVRVEVQASPEHLRMYRFGSVDEALRSCGDVWRYGTGEFLRFCVPKEGRPKTWPLRPEWEEVQRVGFERFPHSGVVPEAIWTGDRERVRRILYGCLTSLGAFDGIRELSLMLRSLPDEVSGIAQRKDFAREVDRRHRKHSRWARGRSVHSAPGQRGRGT